MAVLSHCKNMILIILFQVIITGVIIGAFYCGYLQGSGKINIENIKKKFPRRDKIKVIPKKIPMTDEEELLQAVEKKKKIIKTYQKF